jgi:hypothetical protein
MVLSIERSDVESITVSIEGAFCRGVVRAWLYDGAQSLVDFFRSMATEWYGWLGSKTWSSIEGDCSIEATVDRAGHVTLIVKLNQEMGQHDPWSLKASLEVEAGQLEELAKRAKQVFLNA